MKRILIVLSLASAMLLSGCFENTDEITLKEDGSGVVSITTDMSMLISMMKGMGGAEAIGGGAEKPTDTIVALSNIADSISGLSEEEIQLLKKGKLGLTINLGDEKLITRLEIPFSNIDQVGTIKAISSKVAQYFIGKNIGGSLPLGLDEKMPSSDPMSDYFITTFSAGVIEKKLNKEKYSGLENDQSMKGLKEISENGLPVTNNIIINLPRPAIVTTGKGIIVSENKRKVTIKSSSEDFFDDASGLEFKIEY